MFITITRLCNTLRVFKVVKMIVFRRKRKFDIFFNFVQNIDCVYTLEPPHFEAVLTSTHNLCFRTK